MSDQFPPASGGAILGLSKNGVSFRGHPKIHNDSFHNADDDTGSDSEFSDIDDDFMINDIISMKRKFHPVKNSVISFSETATTSFLRYYAEKYDDDKDNDGAEAKKKMKKKKKKKKYFFESIPPELIHETQALDYCADVLNSMMTSMSNQG